MRNPKTFFGIALLFAGSAFAQAPVRTFVSTTGSDANPCSRTQPCRNFAAAVSAVATNGEVVVLDSGGYGPVSITRSVTIVAPEGVHAAIAPTAGPAIFIDHEPIAVLRGLFLQSHGATIGVHLFSGTVHLERLVVSRFAEGFHADSFSRAVVTDSLFSSNGEGIVAPALAFFDVPKIVVLNSRLENNDRGIRLEHGYLVCLNSLISGSTNVAIDVNANQGNESRMVAERCLAANSEDMGIRVGSLSENGGGLASVRLSDSTITGSARGLVVSDDSPPDGECANCETELLSRGNNTVRGNFTGGIENNGAFTGTFPPR